MWWSNEKRRGDSAVSAQRPHLLSFLCSLYGYISLFSFPFIHISLFICWLCAPQFLPEYQWVNLLSIFHECPSEEIIEDRCVFRWLTVETFVGLSAGFWWAAVDADCHQFPLQFNYTFKFMLFYSFCLANDSHIVLTASLLTILKNWATFCFGVIWFSW